MDRHFYEEDAQAADKHTELAGHLFLELRKSLRPSLPVFFALPPYRQMRIFAINRTKTPQHETHR